MFAWFCIIFGGILVVVGGIIGTYGWQILPKDSESDSTTKPYLNFTDDLIIAFRTPTINEIVAMLPQYFQDDNVSAGKISEALISMKAEERQQYVQSFRMVSLQCNIENSGDGLARGIKLFWDNHLFFTYDSLKAGQRTETNDYYFGSLSISARNKDGVASAVPPPKSYDFWMNAIEKVKSMTQKGMRIASDLDVVYKIHKMKIPIILEIVWKDTNDNAYRNTAKTNMFWNGSTDQLEPWEYSYKKEADI